MSIFRETVEAFIRLVKQDVHSHAVLVSSDNSFEVTNTPSVILQGPTLVEDSSRRTHASLIKKNPDDLSYEESHYPRLYHLDFDVIITTARESDLLDMSEKISRFYQLHPVLTVLDRGDLNLTELIPVGGLKRVNRSNLRQASGRCRIEDCPIYDGRSCVGKLVTDVSIQTNISGETNK